MQTIYEIGGRLDLAITLPDDRAEQKSGRIYLDTFCDTHGIPLVKSPNVNDETVITSIKQYEIDWLFIIGWSQIARDGILAAPRKGVLGIHPTLLPVGRGRAAIPWAILKRLDKTGVTLFKLDGGIDTGDIVAKLEIPLHDRICATELYKMVDEAHITLIRDVFCDLRDDNLVTTPQEEDEASHWPGRKPEDGLIDLTGSVFDADRLVRAVTRPYPGAMFEHKLGKMIVWRAKIVEPSAKRHAADIYLDFVDGTLHCMETEIVHNIQTDQ
jgi:methionyl-tRNA formyltransferase